ncbi:MAG: hypothetical protein PHD21_02335 [Flavobacteriales bacterium]|nr:hypothetical protein [Flavobacteriales bacterium]
MRNLCILAFTVLAITACVKNGDKAPVNPTGEVNLLSTELYTVPVQSGKTTYVTLNSDTIAVATEPMTIYIPKSANVTKAGKGVSITYQNGQDPNAGTYQIWQTIAFEDSKSGDYDYNDLVIHSKYVFSQSKLKVGIHAIALGSVKDIALGCRIYKKDVLVADKIVVENCREELFGGTEGFINTTNYKDPIHYTKYAKKVEFDEVTNASNVSVVWYIVVDGGTKLFAVNDKFSALDANYRPYGLVVTNTGNTYWQENYNSKGGEWVGFNWFEFPAEGVNIETCYPTFTSWLQGGTLDMSKPVGSTFDIDAHRIYEMTQGNAVL